MSVAFQVRRRVGLAGRVTDVAAAKPIAGATVEIVDAPVAFQRALALKSIRHGPRWCAMPERPDRTRTAGDGLFYFLDLPDGEYTITASVPDLGRRYGVYRGTATVSADARGATKVAFVELGLQPTSVRGRVTGPRGKAGLAMAEVRIKGSGERVFTDSKGEYMLSGVEPGKRSVLVHAQGYRPASQPVALEEPGDVASLNFALAEANGDGGPSQRGR